MEQEKNTVKELALGPVKASPVLKWLDKPNVFVRFSSSKSFKPNPRYGFGFITPQGIYGYPFSTSDMKETQWEEWVSNSKNLLLFKLLSWKNILVASEYSESDLVADLETLIQRGYFGEKIKTADQAVKEMQRMNASWQFGQPEDTPTTPFQVLWTVIKKVIYPYKSTVMGSRDRAISWRHLLVKMGYQGIFDNTSSVTSDIKTQMIVFDPKVIKPIGVFPNPYSKEEDY